MVCKNWRRGLNLDLSRDGSAVIAPRSPQRLRTFSWRHSIITLTLVLIISTLIIPISCNIEPEEDDFSKSKEDSKKLVNHQDFGDDDPLPDGPHKGSSEKGGGHGHSSSRGGKGDGPTKGLKDEDDDGMFSVGFVHAFIASLSMIVVSELGDKTFFIAAIMAMRHSRLTVFSGAMSALAFMTVLSALFGYATTIIPRIYTYYISTALFAIFGFKMIYDGVQMSPDGGAEELEEVQATLKKREEDDEEDSSASPEGDHEATVGLISPPKKLPIPSKARKLLFVCFSRVFLQSLSMTFLAEWGDRSQLATVVLAATENIGGVCIGGILGHSLCTGLAVLGGRMIAQKISVRTVTIIGGVVFLAFAVTSLFLSPGE